MAPSAVGNYTSWGNWPFPVARCPLADTCGVDFPVRTLSYCPSPSGDAISYGPKRSETIRLSETGVVRSVARCRGTVRPPETGEVRSVACQEAGGNRRHDLFSPSASKEGMGEPCLASQTTAIREAGGDLDAPRSCAHAIPLGVIGCANSRMRLSSPITPPLVQDRKAGTLGKGRCLGGLQNDVDYREVSN